jgi:hypothetical protein
MVFTSLLFYSVSTDGRTWVRESIGSPLKDLIEKRPVQVINFVCVIHRRDVG